MSYQHFCALHGNVWCTCNSKPWAPEPEPVPGDEPPDDVPTVYSCVEDGITYLSMDNGYDPLVSNNGPWSAGLPQGWLVLSVPNAYHLSEEEAVRLVAGLEP